MAVKEIKFETGNSFTIEVGIFYLSLKKDSKIYNYRFVKCHA